MVCISIRTKNVAKLEYVDEKYLMMTPIIIEHIYFRTKPCSTKTPRSHGVSVKTSEDRIDDTATPGGSEDGTTGQW